MRDEYYADKRDIVKWGGIIHLCTTNRIKTVIQVAYYQKPEAHVGLEFEGPDKKSGVPVPLPEQVSNHFNRDIRHIKRLGDGAGINIVIFRDEFNNADDARSDYHERVVQLIRNHARRKVVFLDPDTGLEPEKSKYKGKHVKPDEVKRIWGCLKPRDFLVFYQHAPHEQQWQESRKKRFATACGVSVTQVGQWTATDIANDVVLFFVEKPL